MNAFHGIALKKSFFMFCYIIWQKCFTYIEFNLMLIHKQLSERLLSFIAMDQQMYI
jgi:hypothetical protein